MGNEAFPNRNPQGEFTSTEENNGFQGFFAAGTRLFIPLFLLVEILISTKGISPLSKFTDFCRIDGVKANLTILQNKSGGGVME